MNKEVATTITTMDPRVRLKIVMSVMIRRVLSARHPLTNLIPYLSVSITPPGSVLLCKNLSYSVKMKVG